MTIKVTNADTGYIETFDDFDALLIQIERQGENLLDLWGTLTLTFEHVEVDEDLLAPWERTLLGLDDEPERVYDDFWDLEPEPVANTSPKRSFFSKVFGRKSA